MDLQKSPSLNSLIKYNEKEMIEIYDSMGNSVEEMMKRFEDLKLASESKIAEHNLINADHNCIRPIETSAKLNIQKDDNTHDRKTNVKKICVESLNPSDTTESSPVTILRRGDFLGALNCCYPQLNLIRSDENPKIPKLDNNFSLFSVNIKHCEEIFATAREYRKKMMLNLAVRDPSTPINHKKKITPEVIKEHSPVEINRSNPEDKEIQIYETIDKRSRKPKKIPGKVEPNSTVPAKKRPRSCERSVVGNEKLKWRKYKKSNYRTASNIKTTVYQNSNLEYLSPTKMNTDKAADSKNNKQTSFWKKRERNRMSRSDGSLNIIEDNKSERMDRFSLNSDRKLFDHVDNKLTYSSVLKFSPSTLEIYKSSEKSILSEMDNEIAKFSVTQNQTLMKDDNSMEMDELKRRIAYDLDKIMADNVK